MVWEGRGASMNPATMVGAAFPSTGAPAARAPKDHFKDCRRRHGLAVSVELHLIALMAVWASLGVEAFQTFGRSSMNQFGSVPTVKIEA